MNNNNNSPETGTIRINPSGFGFFTSNKSGSIHGITDRKESIYVGSALLKNIYDGDTVSVEKTKNNITKVTVLTRSRQSYIGSIGENGKSITMDPGLGFGVFTATTKQTPGTTVRFTLNGKQATITKVIGADYSDADIYERIMNRFTLPCEPVRLHNNALQSLIKTVNKKARHSRRNLRSLVTVTIDGEETKDIDDALSGELCPDGSIRVWVHIADVAEYIKEGSYLDLECSKNSTSTYSPYGVRHMLPEQLAADAISLVQGKDRFVMCAELVISPSGNVSATDVYPATIRSNRRLNYSDITDIINDVPVKIDPAGVGLVRILRTGAQRLGVTRDARAGIDIFRDEPSSDYEAHNLIERIMVAANESVARWVKVRNIPAPRRAHSTFSESSVQVIEKALNDLNITAHLTSPLAPVALAAALHQVPRGYKLNSIKKVISKELGRAYYTLSDAEHFGLGSDDYLHFTSPIRRYPDLLVHRLIKKYLAGQRVFDKEIEQLSSNLEAINRTFNEASSAENALNAARAINDLAIGETHWGVVVSSRGNDCKIFLEGTGVLATLNSKADVRAKVKVRVRSCNAHTLEVTTSLIN